MSGLYDDGAHYDSLLGLQQADLLFYRGLAEELGGPILELACGTGRLTLPIARAGIEITGLDFSEAMLERARAKASAEHLEIAWVRADASDFDLGRKFRLIFIPYNSMSHLHSHAQISGLFESARRHLAPGGRFLIDVHNPSLDLLNRRKGEVYPVEGLNPDLDGAVVVGEEVEYDDAAQIYTIRWHYSDPQGTGNPRMDELRLRMFFPQELDSLVQNHGFRIVAKYGDFQRKPFATGDLKQIVICEAG